MDEQARGCTKQGILVVKRRRRRRGCIGFGAILSRVSGPVRLTIKDGDEQAET